MSDFVAEELEGCYRHRHAGQEALSEPPRCMGCGKRLMVTKCSLCERMFYAFHAHGPRAPYRVYNEDGRIVEGIARCEECEKKQFE